MKIAVPAQGADLNAQIGYRLGTLPYLMIVDLETMTFEAVPMPDASTRGHTGMHAVAVAIGKGVDAVLTGYCSPTAMNYLAAHGIVVITGVTGTVAQAVEQYKKQIQYRVQEVKAKPVSIKPDIDRVTLVHALKRSVHQFTALLPTLVGVVLLIGLVKAFISTELLSAVFSNNTLLNTFEGAVFGSILAGNPINSYVFGAQMLAHGVSLFAVTAFMISWVTVGMVQLPAEIVALGKNFALIRNSIAFVLSIAIAIVTVLVLNLVGG